jgi:hypothetical protein
MPRTFHPGFSLGWKSNPMFDVFGFLQMWKWQQANRYGYTLRVGWLLLKFGQPED